MRAAAFAIVALFLLTGNVVTTLLASASPVRRRAAAAALEGGRAHERAVHSKRELGRPARRRL